MAGNSHSRDHRSLATVAGDRPSRSAFSMYSSATSPNVVPTATLATMRCRRLAAAGSSPPVTASRARVARLAGVAQRHVGIAAERQLLLDAVHPVLEPPEPAARRRHQQIEPATVRQLVILACAASRSSPRCRSAPSVPCRPKRPPKRPPLRTGCRRTTANDGGQTQRQYRRISRIFQPFAALRRTEKWCPGKDSNLHALRHTDLNRARLPIPPPGQARG